MSGDDLPGYVGRLFDSYVEHPENTRLHDWVNLSPSNGNIGGSGEIEGRPDGSGRG